MNGTITDELVVKVPASEAWKLYGSLRLARYVQEALPGLFSKIDVVEGDGAAGTVLELFLLSGTEGGAKRYKEKFTVVDDEKRVKVSEVVEGGYLDLGFSLYTVTLEVVEAEKEAAQCVTRATIEYEVTEEAAADSAALVSMQPLTAVMRVAADYLEKTYTSTS